MLAAHIVPQEFMRNDGILSFDYGRIIAPLVECAHIHSGYVGEIDGAVHSAFIRADDHQVVLVNDQVRFCAQERLHKLIGRVEAVESVERNGILHSGIVSVEGDDVVDAHIRQLLKRQGTVQRFSLGALMLTALIQERHDHIKPVRFAVGG